MPAITLSPPAVVDEHQDILDLVSDWHSALNLSVSSGELVPGSVKVYRHGWDLFYTWLLDRDAHQVDSDVIRAWIGDLLSAGYAANTVNVWLAGVRSFFAWAVGARRLVINPCSGVRSAARHGAMRHHRREILTNAEIVRVLAVPDRSTVKGKRDLCILSLMAYTGVRTIEVYRADLADLKTRGGRLVLYVQGKGRAEKDELVVIAHPEAESVVHDWVSARGSAPGSLFTSLVGPSKGGRLSLRSIRRIVKGTFRAAGVVGMKSAHSLRHTAITAAVLHGAPVEKVKNMARHSSIDTTMIYYHELDRLSDPAESYISYK